MKIRPLHDRVIVEREEEERDVRQHLRQVRRHQVKARAAAPARAGARARASPSPPPPPAARPPA